MRCEIVFYPKERREIVILVWILTHTPNWISHIKHIYGTQISPVVFSSDAKLRFLGPGSGVVIFFTHMIYLTITFYVESTNILLYDDCYSVLSN